MGLQKWHKVGCEDHKPKLMSVAELCEYEKILDLFYERAYELSEDSILAMSQEEPSAGINNVIVGMHRKCYGLIFQTESTYKLFYVVKENNLMGYVLPLEVTMSAELRFDMVSAFSKHIAHYHAENQVLAFNSFQSLQKQMLEKLDYVTHGDELYDKFGGAHVDIILPYSYKGLIYIPFIDMTKAYRSIFIHNEQYEYFDKSKSYVYLMVNTSDGRVKIGHSTTPYRRERTLQSQEPVVNLIAYWVAQKDVETELHKIYSVKRKRGEWFQLQMADLHAIKSFMTKYEE